MDILLHAETGDQRDGDDDHAGDAAAADHPFRIGIGPSLRPNGMDDEKETLDDPAEIMDEGKLGDRGGNEAQHCNTKTETYLPFEGEFLHTQPPFQNHSIIGERRAQERC